jgi:hypothetical protein
VAAKREPKQTPGQLMVSAILAEMAEVGCEPDSKEQVLLDTARKLVDRLDALERILAKDKLMLTSPSGVVRMHPAAIEHRQLASSLARVLANVVIGDSSAGKSPVKQRAAQTRWRSHNLAKADRVVS